MLQQKMVYCYFLETFHMFGFDIIVSMQNENNILYKACFPIMDLLLLQRAYAYILCTVVYKQGAVSKICGTNGLPCAVVGSSVRRQGKL